MPFKPFTRKTIFVSCSRDMAAAVPVIHAAVDEINRRLPFGAGWDVYHWSRSDTPWTADTTWQDLIPRASDPLCHLVICLFGERIGEPLPPSFPWPADLTKPDWVAWPAAEGDKPRVTGTLFELIDALEGPRHTGVARKTLALFKVDGGRFAKKGLDAFDRNYGFSYEYDKLCGTEHRPSRADGDAYDRQIDALDSVAEIVFREGARPWHAFGRSDLSPEECFKDLRHLLDRQLPDLLGVPRAQSVRREPKGLFSYAPEDADILFGRDRIIDKLITRLIDLSRTMPPFGPMLLLAGRSGEGKSSVMRAGLTGRLSRGVHSDRAGAFVGIDATVRSLVMSDPLLALAERIEMALGQPLMDGHNLDQFVEADRPAKLKQALARHLKDRPQIGAQPTRLFLGLDQLDDVLFMAEEDAAVGSRLRELFGHLHDLCVAELVWCVLTIPTDQIDKLTALAPDVALQSEILSPPGEEDLQDIVERSFTSFRLPREETDRVIAEAADWLRRQESPGPILPLVSALMLEMVLIAKEQARQTLGATKSEPVAPVTMETVLDRLGERAWKEVSRGVDYASDARLARLLRQLVITRVGGGETKGLRNCSVDHAAVRASPELVAALKRQRFLHQPDAGTLRLTHEAIVNGWARARAWYDDDRKHQVTLALIEPKAARWQEDVRSGRVARLLADPEELEAAALLWMTWKDDPERLPVDFLRASLLAVVSSFQAGGDFVGPNGLSHFHAAIVIADRMLWIDWSCALEEAQPLDRARVIGHKSPTSGRTALISAAGSGSISIVCWLLDRGSDPLAKDNDGWTALHTASASGHLETSVKLLPVSDVNAATEKQVTALHLASLRDDEAVVRLLATRADIDVRGHEGMTALHFAASSGSEALRILLPYANINARSDNGFTALHYAALNEQDVAMRLLMDLTDIDARDKHRNTALHIAAWRGSEAIVRLLIKRADVNATGMWNMNALHFAVLGGHEAIVRLLTGHIDFNGRMDNQRSSLHIAAEAGHLGRRLITA